MLLIVKSLVLFGVVNINDIFFDDYLKMVIFCKIGMLIVEQFYVIIQEKVLWGLILNYLMFMYNWFYNIVMLKGVLMVYEMICQQLMLLMNEDEFYCWEIIVECYICDKIQFFCSGVMCILVDFKMGGFIEMEDGRLIKINKFFVWY